MEGKDQRPGEPPHPDGRRVEVDPASGAVRGWFDPDARPLAAGPFAPAELARAVLRRQASLYRWQPELLDLRDAGILRAPGVFSVRLRQELGGVPVGASEIVVNVRDDGAVDSVYNQYHYDIPPGLDPAQVAVSPVEARRLVARLARAYRRRRLGRPTRIVYRHHHVDRPLPKPPRRPSRERARFLRAVAAARRRGGGVEGRHYLAWDVTLSTERPRHRWRLVVDATTGRLLEARDRLSYANPHGKVFDPNPIVTSGDLTLSSQSSAAKLNAQRVPVTLARLDPKVGGYYHLDGAWVSMEEVSDPAYAEPRSKTGSFVFSAKSRKFLDVMAYHHIDRFQQYVQADLGLSGMGDFSLAVDPQGSSSDTSLATGAAIAFGEGGVADASDAMVILHEYGHALQDSANPNSNLDNFESGIAEGFCDFLAAVYYDEKHADPVHTRALLFSWDANPTDGYWPGRRCDLPAPAGAAAWDPGDGYGLAEHWASTMFELYRKLGGDSTSLTVRRAARDLVIRLHLVANARIPGADATTRQMAEQIEAADAALAGWRYPDGLHRKLIYDTFRRRNVPGFPALAVDVHVNDGRGGGYGAADGNDDNFPGVLWRESLRDTADIWTRRAPYPAGAAPKPADHESPQANQPAGLYVLVKNRGATASGPVTVRAFQAPAGSTLAWPAGWVELAAPAVQPANVPPGGSVVAGPFPWALAPAGPVPVLAIVECASDRAVTQTLAAGAVVPHADVLPFDNNIATRRIQVI